jgi:hypothetical protein
MDSTGPTSAKLNSQLGKAKKTPKIILTITKPYTTLGENFGSFLGGRDD